MNGGSGRLFKLTAGVLASAVFVFGGTAFATTAYEGSDYSYTFNSNQQVAACDQEDDGYNAYGYFQTWEGGYNSATDTNGAVAGCGSSGVYPSRIQRHQTCESRGVWADACSGWVSQ